jgi:hypothetical protein
MAVKQKLIPVLLPRRSQRETSAIDDDVANSIYMKVQVDAKPALRLVAKQTERICAPAPARHSPCH